MWVKRLHWLPLELWLFFEKSLCVLTLSSTATWWCRWQDWPRHHLCTLPAHHSPAPLGPVHPGGLQFYPSNVSTGSCLGAQTSSSIQKAPPHTPRGWTPFWALFNSPCSVQHFLTVNSGLLAITLPLWASSCWALIQRMDSLVMWLCLRPVVPPGWGWRCLSYSSWAYIMSGMQQTAHVSSMIYSVQTPVNEAKLFSSLRAILLTHAFLLTSSLLIS